MGCCFSKEDNEDIITFQESSGFNNNLERTNKSKNNASATGRTSVSRKEQLELRKKNEDNNIKKGSKSRLKVLKNHELDDFSDTNKPDIVLYEGFKKNQVSSRDYTDYEYETTAQKTDTKPALFSERSQSNSKLNLAAKSSNSRIFNSNSVTARENNETKDNSDFNYMSYTESRNTPDIINQKKDIIDRYMKLNNKYTKSQDLTVKENNLVEKTGSYDDDTNIRRVYPKTITSCKTMQNIHEDHFYVKKQELVQKLQKQMSSKVVPNIESNKFTATMSKQNLMKYSHLFLGGTVK